MGVGRGILSLHVALRLAATEAGPGRFKCPLGGSPGRPPARVITTALPPFIFRHHCT